MKTLTRISCCTEVFADRHKTAGKALSPSCSLTRKRKWRDARRLQLAEAKALNELLQNTISIIPNAFLTLPSTLQLRLEEMN